MYHRILIFTKVNTRGENLQKMCEEISSNYKIEKINIEPLYYVK